MAEASPPGSGRAAALLRLERWLEANHRAVRHNGKVPDDFTDAWRFSLSAGGERFDLLFLIDGEFPRSKPDIAFVSARPFPSYPHVEADGRICVLNAIDEIDPDDPVGVARHLIQGARNILEVGLSGRNNEDFRREFLSYWNPAATGPSLLSILDPSEPSREIFAWRKGELRALAESEAALRTWPVRFLGSEKGRGGRVERALLLWLPEPLLPSDYPESPAALRALAESVGMAATFDRIAGAGNAEMLVVIGADSENGPCLAGAVVTRSGRNNAIIPGFRKGRAPPNLARGQALHGRLVRSAVTRADVWWIHGRDSNPDLGDLLMKKVAIIGCGSLGSPIARLLAQAGVGALALIDPEKLEWANVGRHALGAESVGHNKASELAKRLSRDFPHGRFTDHAVRWQEAIEEIAQCDLAICAIGSWAQESALSEWQVDALRPPVLYGWTEPHAVAGHGVVLAAGAGCLRCAMSRFGEANGRVVDWPGPTLQRVPACGAHFQPYGAPAIAAIAAMIAELAIDQLAYRAMTGAHRILAGRASTVIADGGQWSPAWLERIGAPRAGGQIEEFQWLPDPACPACGGNGIA